MKTKEAALGRLERLIDPLAEVDARARGGQIWGSNPLSIVDKTSVQSGGPGGNRTLDILLKSLREPSVGLHATSVRELVMAWYLRLELGRWVVSSGVKQTDTRT